MRLSVELVPRDTSDFAAQLDALGSEVQHLLDHGFDTVNVPSSPHYGLDPISAAAAVVERGWRAVPHLRAMDVRRTELDALARRIAAAGIEEVLVVAGDPPQHGSPHAPDTTPADLLAALSARLPALTCYAAFDPNQTPDDETLARLDAKLAAGASGLFGQPAFTSDAMAGWHGALNGRVAQEQVFWGAAPVLGERSRAWWERVNGIAFPADFTPTLEDWRRRLPALAAAARDAGGNLYVMPIRAPIDATLAPLRAPRRAA